MNLAEAYFLLEVPFFVSDAIVKEQYRYLVKFYHPDNPNTGCQSEFKKVLEAYNLIKASR